MALVESQATAAGMVAPTVVVVVSLAPPTAQQRRRRQLHAQPASTGLDVYTQVTSPRCQVDAIRSFQATLQRVPKPNWLVIAYGSSSFIQT